MVTFELCRSNVNGKMAVVTLKKCRCHFEKVPLSLSKSAVVTFKFHFHTNAEWKTNMNWNKYTLDEWLEQLGAWYNLSRMRGGHSPDELRTCQLYHLMRENDESLMCRPSSKSPCQITDCEAIEVEKMLVEATRTASYEVAYAIKMLIFNKVEGENLYNVSNRFNVGRSKANISVIAARFYLAGRYAYISL